MSLPPLQVVDSPAVLLLSLWWTLSPCPCRPTPWDCDKHETNGLVCHNYSTQWTYLIDNPFHCAYPRSGNMCFVTLPVPPKSSVPRSTVTERWISVAFFSADLADCTNSKAFLNVSPDLAKSLRCTLGLRTPHTMRSRSMSSSMALKSQCSESP